MAAPSPFHIADLRKDNEELRGKNSELANEITALKKGLFSKEVLLQTLQRNLRERDDSIALCARLFAKYDAPREESQGSPTAAKDSITVKSARHATTDEVLTTSRNVSAQSNKEVNRIARPASSMRPESPAFVPSSIVTAPSTKTPANIFLPSLDHSIHAFTPSSGHFAGVLNPPSQPSQDCSADLKCSVMQNIENGRPVLVGAVDQSTKLDFDSSQHTLTPLIPMPNNGQQTLLEAGQSTAEGFVESKSEVVSQNDGQLAPLISSKYGNGQTSSPLPGANSSTSGDDPYSPLHILDTPLEQAPYVHQGLQPIKQAALTQSAHIQPKSIATPVINDRSYGETSEGESRTYSWREPGTASGNENATTLLQESTATESGGTVEDRPEAPKPTFTRVLGSALDPQSRLLVLKKSSSLVTYPWAGHQSIDLRFSAVLIKLTLPNGKAISFGILGQSSMENAGTRLYLTREESGATGLKLAVKVFPAGKDPLIMSTAEGNPFLAFGVKFNFPGQINTESIALSTYPAAKSSTFPRTIREIETLRDPITKEIPADIHRIAFTYSEKDIDIVQLKSLDREDHKTHLQWDTETLKLFDFMSLLRESSSKTINIMFMNRENYSEDLIRKWFRSVRQNCEQVKGNLWYDSRGYPWERIEDTDRNKRWRLQLRLPETRDASQP